MKIALLLSFMVGAAGVLHAVGADSIDVTAMLLAVDNKTAKQNGDRSPLVLAAPTEKWSRKKKATAALTAFLLATSFAADGVAVTGTTKMNEAAGPYTTYPITGWNGRGHPEHPIYPDVEHRPDCTYRELNNVTSTSVPFSAKGRCACDMGWHCWCTLETCPMTKNDEYHEYNTGYTMNYLGQVSGIVSRSILLTGGAVYAGTNWLKRLVRKYSYLRN